MRALAETAVALAACALLVMMGVTVADVVGRNLADLAVPGFVEIVELSMVATTFLGIGAAFLAGGHITVSLLDSLAPPPVSLLMRRMAGVVAVLAMAGLTALAGRELADALYWSDTTVDLGIPVSAHWLTITGGFALGTICAVAALRSPPP